jgi:hypothetical protein
MARTKKLPKDPYDLAQRQAYIKSKTDASESTRLQKLVEKYPNPIRDLILRPGSDISAFELTGHTQITAAAIHVRGQVAPMPCNHCEDGKGHYQECIVFNDPEFEDLHKQCCTNCLTGLRTTKDSKRTNICSHAQSK